jgi:hypothetical protein
MQRIQLQIETNREFIRRLKKVAIDQDKTMRRLVIDDLVAAHPELNEARDINEQAELSSAEVPDVKSN